MKRFTTILVLAFALTTIIIAALALATAPAAAQPVNVIYNSTPPTLQNRQEAQIQGDANGNLKVTLSGGTAASGAATSGNPVKIGCVYNTTLPTLDNGDVGDCQADISGNVRVHVTGQNATGVDTVSNTALTSATLSAGTASTSPRPFAFAGFAFNGTSWDRLRGDTNGIATTPGLSSTTWSYSNGSTGILSNTTTAVTIKAAAGAGVRNYIDSCTINTTAFGVAAPLAIRDGAGGTVLFALNVPTAGFLQPVVVRFAQPLRGSANTLLEVVTTTANTSGTVWVNCQGHTGS